MTDSLYNVYTETIIGYDQTDSAAVVLDWLATSDMIAGRWGRAAYSLDFHAKYLPEERLIESLKQKKEQCLNNMVAITLLKTNPDLRFYDYFSTRLAPSDLGFLILKKYIGIPINGSDWDRAMASLNQFEPIYSEKQDEIDEMKEILSRPMENLLLDSIKGLNTLYNEWDPNITADGKYMFYSFTGGGKADTDVVLATIEGDSVVKSGRLRGPLSGNGNETCDNISYDSKRILVSGNLEGSLGRFDIYFAERIDGVYDSIFHLPSPVNSEYHDEGSTLSPDGNVMIFTSDRPGGIGEFHPQGTLWQGSGEGNMDIYAAFKNPATGKFDSVVNLGHVINTPYAERSPNLHADGRTLYFSSNGHPGLGGLDVFVSKRVGEGWLEWTKPINLGKQINTISNDWGYKINLDGETAYFAALNRTIGVGGWDIFKVELPQVAKAATIYNFNAVVVDAESGQPLESRIVWEDLSTGQELGSVYSSPYSGSFGIPVLQGKSYRFYADKEGYFPFSSKINWETVERLRTDTLFLTKIPISKGTSSVFTANSILFQYNSAELLQESSPELDRVEGILESNRNLKVTIEGHTDEAGSREYNQSLSQKRAAAVMKYLLNKGIKKERMEAVGYGEDKPISTTDDQKNRRVEIVFYL
ncbi:MAG: hypothetical protein Kapaf2KO_07280 [Candidatus Kapaibacteriales bacterium]